MKLLLLVLSFLINNYQWAISNQTSQKMETVIVPNRKEYKLTHYRQQYQWDCGLACIMMLLPYLQRKYFTENFQQICDQEGFGQSTWTIDLCYILKRFNVQHYYFTKVIGVNPLLSETMNPKDRDRVNLKFRNAESNGIKVDKKTVSLTVLVKHLSSDGPLILLTSSGYLDCDICMRKDFSKIENVTYVGHYVILVGYDVLMNKIFYRNPSKDDHVCVTKMENMERARIATGTDEDVILIYFY